MARTKPLHIRAGDIELSATLVLPPGADAGPHPAVLMIPGLLPRDRHGRFDRTRHRAWFAPGPQPAAGVFARLAAALARRGVASLRYDPRGCGRSGGAWDAGGLFTRIDDARDALAVLRGHSAVDSSRLGLIGLGEGGWMAFSVAAADPAVGPLTLIGTPARGLRDVLRRGAAERARRRLAGRRQPHPFMIAFDRGLEELIERTDRGEAMVALPVARGRRLVIGLAAWEQAFRISGRALATLQSRSVSVIHGGADAWVDPDESVILAEALAARGAPWRHVVPGAGHDLAEAPDELVRDLAADLAARLQPRALPTVLLSLGDSPPPRL
jgi:pimeloyl-ACP methyl ester carboxylesterase